MHTDTRAQPLARPRARQRARRRRDERGAAGVELLVMATTLFVLFTSLVQYGIRFHAHRVAEAAAREGAVAAARFDGTTDAGNRTASEYVEQDGTPAVTGSRVTANRSDTRAQVRVTVEVVALLPWLDEPITTSATVPVERFVE